MADTERKQSGGAVRFLVGAAAVVVVVAGMKSAQSLLVPFLLAAFIAIICGPLLFWLRRKGVPDGLALLGVVIGVVLAALSLAALIGTSIADFTDSLPLYQSRLQEKTVLIGKLLSRFNIAWSEEALRQYVDPGAAMRLASGLLTGLGNALSNLFLILLTVIFILLEGATFPVKLRAAFGDATTSGGLQRFLQDVNRYMAIKTWISLVTGIMVTLFLALLGVDYALLWGVLAFLFNYVPNIGSIIAAVPAVLLALIQLGPGHALMAGAGYLILNVVIGNVIEPRFMGQGLGLSTLVVFLSLIFWGWVLGPVGMLLSIPLTMMVKIALSSSEETAWIGILLGTGRTAGE